MQTHSQAIPWRAYCYGMIGPSRHLRLVGKFPEPNGYAEVAEEQINLAGEAIAGAWVLQRLGVQTMIAGRWFSDTALSRQVLKMCLDQGLDVTQARVVPGYTPIDEVVIGDGPTRTVFGAYGKILFSEIQWDAPREQDIANCHIALLDPMLGEASQLAARFCVQHKVPYLTIDLPAQNEMAQHAACVIISEEFLRREHRGEDYQILFTKYMQHCKGMVLFTFGDRPLWWSHNGPMQSFTPFAIKPVDTTGAGDSFRAGLAYALLQGQQGSELIRTAAAVAALVCLGSPGVLQSPSAEELRVFLQQFA